METLSCASQWQKDLDVKSYFLPPALMDLGTLHVGSDVFRGKPIAVCKQKGMNIILPLNIKLLRRFLFSFHSLCGCPASSDSQKSASSFDLITSEEPFLAVCTKLEKTNLVSRSSSFQKYQLHQNQLLVGGF